jgi:rhamnosyltransferase
MGMVDVVDVIVRCRNEMPHTKRTLDGLAAQTGTRARVLFIDCGSTDGSRDAAVADGCSIVDVAPEQYVPGAVLNAGMRRTRSELVAFVNADAVPVGTDALKHLVAPLVRGGPDLAASYGRQLPRADADPSTRLEYARAFGEAALETRLGTFFSMAASAIRRSTWQCLPFDEGLRYSEDVDWIRRAQALGFRVEYAAAAQFEHSHRYDLHALFRRRSGEGTADTLIHRLGEPSWIGDLGRPLVGSLLRDARRGVLSPQGVARRVVQAAGYFAGRRKARF